MTVSRTFNFLPNWPGSPSPSAQAAPSRDRHLWPSKSSVRGFGYDYDYGYGYVKSVDSMDNVNSVRCGNGLDNVNSTNSAVIRRRGSAAGRKGAPLVLLTLSRPLPQRRLMTLSMHSTLLT